MRPLGRGGRRRPGAASHRGREDGRREDGREGREDGVGRGVLVAAAPAPAPAARCREHGSGEDGRREDGRRETGVGNTGLADAWPLPPHRLEGWGGQPDEQQHPHPPPPVGNTGVGKTGVGKTGVGKTGFGWVSWATNTWLGWAGIPARRRWATSARASSTLPRRVYWPSSARTVTLVRRRRLLASASSPHPSSAPGCACRRTPGPRGPWRSRPCRWACPPASAVVSRPGGWTYLRLWAFRRWSCRLPSLAPQSRQRTPRYTSLYHSAA